ncbi:uncharacterized protein N0V89_006277 [Didymosphaeria variabile]|uniref:Uncharacterized protein n=1 Tax=Didymosphaeria variabile TaxID=1932322 RepID=A0A9W8XPT4_9PLEO|nr:uncharacterized protein N0V89_006277 [Didymosphaeria variabile]KAJ4354540.1 hypothetical protein N0V89_006277 [Didymosphaeria variabile]
MMSDQTNFYSDNAATHHDSSELPAMTMSEFKQKGGVLGGRGERYDGFEGEPKHIGGTLKHMMEGKTSKRDSAHHDQQVRDGAMHGDFDPLDGGKHNTSAGRLGQTAEDANRHATMAEREHEHATGGRTAGLGAGAGAAGLAGNNHSHGNVRGVEEGGLRGEKGALGSDRHGMESGAGMEKKPSLMDKLNPKKDSDGDGKKGFMK